MLAMLQKPSASQSQCENLLSSAEMGRMIEDNRKVKANAFNITLVSKPSSNNFEDDKFVTRTKSYS